MADDIGDTVKENVSNPKSARSDMGEVEQHSLSDQIEAAKFFRNDDVRNDPFKGLGLRQIIPGDTV